MGFGHEFFLESSLFISGIAGLGFSGLILDWEKRNPGIGGAAAKVKIKNLFS